jgi:hypothetical protein
LIYLIGVEHTVQDDKWSKKGSKHGAMYGNLIQEFRAYVYRIIESHRISILAEEYNEGELRDGKNSVLKDIAESFKPGMPHFYCEPTEREREDMGIPEHKKMEGEVLKSYNLPYKDFTHYRCFGDGQVSCDKLRKQKKLIEKKYWPKREEYWLDKVKEHIDDSIL